VGQRLGEYVKLSTVGLNVGTRVEGVFVGRIVVGSPEGVVVGKTVTGFREGLTEGVTVGVTLIGLKAVYDGWLVVGKVLGKKLKDAPGG
jgi:hypothetical protein